MLEWHRIVHVTSSEGPSRIGLCPCVAVILISQGRAYWPIGCLYLLFLPFIRDNFVICYELLDELVDFGYPQTTDGKILQEYITQVGDQFI